MAPGALLAAEDTRYRVEVLLLTHLDHIEPAREQTHIRDYSLSLDFLTPIEEAPPAESADGTGTDQETSLQSEQPVTDGAEGEAEIPEEEPDPNAVVHIEEMSDEMPEAWRRLRLSAPFRPEQYLSWEQGSEAPFPALRIHDLEAILIDDPYADMRREEKETSTVFADSAGLSTLGQDSIPRLPEPTVFYRLDGTATLKRSRFLHLDLDLQLRYPLWQETPTVRDFQSLQEDEPRTPKAFLVHELQQSRQVKTGRLEYFDGPVLGVLAFVTTVEPDATASLEAEGESD